MKYSEIISLNEFFQPVYDITNEPKQCWKSFIPNERFYEVIKSTLDMLQAGNKKNIWIQGTYGTGKSHAAAVVKHLLSDDFYETETFLETLRTQTRERIKNFRASKRIFPVVLKGSSGITDSRSLSLVLERAVKRALEISNIEVDTESDFEKMLKQVQDEAIDWNRVLEDNKDLTIYVKNKADLEKRLKAQDIGILKILESIASARGWHFSHVDICKWLAEVAAAVKSSASADGLMIFWDEFTPVLELERRSELLSLLQDIAELSFNSDVFLFLISHRKPSQAGLNEEDVKKVYDRFQVKDYSMEPLTTYHILSNAIRKDKPEEYLSLQSEIFDKFSDLNTIIKKIIGDGNQSVKSEITNIFPIHPYTGYLATFIARHLGSTERSIFSFLYDEERGFKKFISVDYQKTTLLTADYLWDFFKNEFEADTSHRFSAILEKYNLYVNDLQILGEQYVSVFKVILLLNILYRMISVTEKESLVAPSQKNIVGAFLAALPEDELLPILNYLDKKEIIRRTPDNLFVVSSTALPPKEVEDEKIKLRDKYIDLKNLLEFSTESTVLLTQTLGSNILRDKEIGIYWGNQKQNILQYNMSKDFKKSYALHLAVILSRNEEELNSLDSRINELLDLEEFKDVVFLVLEEPIRDDRFERFINYLAEHTVAHSHNFKEDAANYKNFADDTVANWIHTACMGYVTIRTSQMTKKALVSQASSFINASVSTTIFKYGLENIKETTKNQNIWRAQYSTKACEIFMFSNSLSDLIEKTQKGIEMYLRSILRDQNNQFIVEDDLTIRGNTDIEHPIKAIQDRVTQTIENLSEPNFHIGATLQFLTRSPFGLYSNMVNMGALSFVLKKFVGTLYEGGTGQLIEKEGMRDRVVEIFKFWQEGKEFHRLNVRLGTAEEKELCDLLADLFDLDGSGKGLNVIRFRIREFIRKLDCPFWALNYLAISEPVKKAVDEICNLIRSIDNEIDVTYMRTVLALVKNNKLDLSLKMKEAFFQQGFHEFLKSIEAAHVQDGELVQVKDYLKGTMQEEVYLWEVDKVVNKVLEWRLSISTAIPGGPDWPDVLPSGGGAIASDGWPNVYKIKEEVKTKLKEYPGDLKTVLLKLIDEHPNLCSILLRYLT